MAVVEAMAFTTGTPIRARTLPARETISGPSGHATMAGLSQEEWLHEVRVQIKELLLLDEGWDSSVAAAIASSAVELAVSCLTVLAEAVDGLRRPYVSPTANGGVNLEWHGPDAHFDITVEEDVSVYVSAPEVDWEGVIRDIPTDAVAVLFARFADR